MKGLPKKLLPLTLFGIAITSLFSVQPAQAFTVTLEQVGANVVATGSGAVNLTGLTFSLLSGGVSSIDAGEGLLLIAGGAFGAFDGYTGVTGPTSFGSGGAFFANTSSGDFVGIAPQFFGLIAVPDGYVSNSPLSDSMTIDNATLVSLGLRSGTYTWTWGTGLPNQNFTLIIPPGGVPDGGSTVSLLGFALLGLAAFRRKLSC